MDWRWEVARGECGLSFAPAGYPDCWYVQVSVSGGLWVMTEYDRRVVQPAIFGGNMRLTDKAIQ